MANLKHCVLKEKEKSVLTEEDIDELNDMDCITARTLIRITEQKVLAKVHKQQLQELEKQFITDEKHAEKERGKYACVICGITPKQIIHADCAREKGVVSRTELKIREEALANYKKGLRARVREEQFKHRNNETGFRKVIEWLLKELGEK
jgi:hypothetical protein